MDIDGVDHPDRRPLSHYRHQGAPVLLAGRKSGEGCYIVGPMGPWWPMSLSSERTFNQWLVKGSD